ncbi:C40 family peptidase [Roseateles paludis]|uniref:C40 family peptidase n=1 Tax=Roseateles paludis TaxID=3145238 RepID=A0ABV0G3C1_9BURK
MPVSRALAHPLSLLTLCLALGLGLAPAVQAQGVAQAAVTQPAPPPGTMMGSYGASLQQQALAAAANGATPNRSAANDAVTRFLTERGLVPAPDSAPARLLGSVRDTASELVLSAMNFLGVRYTRGGTSIENGFDCSGFTRHIFEMSVGLVLPRRADEQARSENLKSVEKDELKPGDLVFFNTMKRTFSHVGIYVGEGRFIHAPRTGSAVRVEDMRDAYWAKRFTGARRADLKAAAAADTATLQR